MDDGPGLSIVVVNWNSGPYLERLLSALDRCPPAVPHEVVVVDNGSRDGSAEAAERRPGVALIRNAGNRGLAAANNQGIGATSAPLVLIANPDTEPGPGALDEMVALMERHPGAAFVVPRLEHPDGSLQASAGDLPGVGQALLGRTLDRRRARGGDPTAGLWWHGWDHGQEREIPRGAEACYLVRRAAIEAVGPQDPRFRLDWEGVEWTARARQAGWEVWMAPKAVVRHAGGVSVAGAGVRWVVQSHLGMYRYLSPRVATPLRPVLAAAVAARGTAKALALAAGLPLYRWAHRGRGQATRA